MNSQSQQTNPNLYHMFLRFLYFNLKETSSSSNVSVWRTFKGRLYTRLHDKRIAELDLTGFVNLAYLFFVLIKCFSGSSLLSESQLKYEQLESFFRILNVFTKTKNLQKVESIFSLTSYQTANSASGNSSAKLNAIKAILNTKFVALRLWFESNELNNSNNEEIETIFIRQEIPNALNNWLAESVTLFNLDNQSHSAASSNQIARFKFNFLFLIFCFFLKI